MRRTHHISGAHPPNAGREIPWRYTEEKFFTQIFHRWWGRSRAACARLPTHINIRAADTDLAKDSVVLLEQIRTLDKHRLRERAGQITPEDQKRVDQALDVSLGLTSY